MELREAVAHEIDRLFEHLDSEAIYKRNILIDHILSLCQADTARREREAFCDGAAFAADKYESHDAFARNWAMIEAVNRYPEAKP